MLGRCRILDLLTISVEAGSLKRGDRPGRGETRRRAVQVRADALQEIELGVLRSEVFVLAEIRTDVEEAEQLALAMIQADVSVSESPSVLRTQASQSASMRYTGRKRRRADAAQDRSAIRTSGLFVIIIGLGVLGIMDGDPVAAFMFRDRAARHRGRCTPGSGRGSTPSSLIPGMKRGMRVMSGTQDKIIQAFARAAAAADGERPKAACLAVLVLEVGEGDPRPLRLLALIRPRSCSKTKSLVHWKVLMHGLRCAVRTVHLAMWI